MRGRHVIAAAALSGATLLAGTGIAGAQTTTPQPTPNRNGAAVCQRLDQIVSRLTEAETRLAERIERLRTEVLPQLQASNPERAARLEARIDKMEERLARIPDAISTMQERCASAPTTTRA